MDIGSASTEAASVKGLPTNSQGGTVWRTLWAFLKEALGFQVEPMRDMPFGRHDVERYHAMVAVKGEVALDPQTVADLDLNAYAETFFPQTSIFCQQTVCRMLRIGSSAAEVEAARARYQTLATDPALLDRFIETCKPLREASSEISELLFSDTTTTLPGWTRHLWLLPCLSVVSIFATAVTWWAVLGLVAAFFAIGYLQLRTYPEISHWDPQRKTLLLLLKVAKGLSDGAEADTSGLSAHFGQDAQSCERMLKVLRPAKLFAQMDFIGAYADWFLLRNVLKHYRSIRNFEANRQLLRDIFLRTGRFETDLAVARHLRQCGTVCWAERGTGREILFDGALNPFLPDGLPLSIQIASGSVFLSGQNGVGKSTMLRTIGINLVLARTFGYCHARRASVPPLPVHTSIRNDDSLAGGESLYMAELRRAKELLAAADGPANGVFIIDEIFRGTNHLEAVAVSAGVLRALAAKGVVLVSSHNLVLAPLLRGCMEPLCIQPREGAQAEVCFAPGVLGKPNGIALMKSYGFGADVERHTEKVADWLGTYLAYPKDVPRELTGRMMEDGDDDECGRHPER